MARAAVIGAGIVGLFSAHELTRAGWQVSLYDAGAAAPLCSRGNAGMLVPSHIVPLAAPGVLDQVFTWLLDPHSPFRLKARPDIDLWRWARLFLAHCTQEHVKTAAPLLMQLGARGRRLWSEAAESLPFPFGFHERGLLMLCRTEDGLEEEAEAAMHARELGIEAEILAHRGLTALEPFAGHKAVGGVFYPGDAQIDPPLLTDGLRAHLAETGVEFVAEQVGEVAEVQGDVVVLAAGAWTEQLAKGLGIRMPLQGGKGYSFELARGELQTRIPSLLLEDRVAVTPMADRVRIAGTLELVGTDLSVDARRVEGLHRALPRFYAASVRPPLSCTWSGLRPCSPDGLPYIGQIPGTRYLVATGHGTLGVSLAPLTGRLIAQMADGRPTDLETGPLSPVRFG
ncbi:MAG: FAD-dependent oxidoreductase [Fimbriimonadaceae bacterium]|nr:FAD-dependent oxidoreductase [Fimbriimonadaceae bacterium]QYK56722.1 MAG: FAD-dependent oxidoreductase [Fimbriimonadaceae bacterium]